MKHFWEQTPEWQRAEGLYAAFEEAQAREEKAGRDLLGAIACYGPALTSRESEVRERYLDACRECLATGMLWRAADAAFKVSAAGQARGRYWKDPLALPAAESEVEA